MEELREVLLYKKYPRFTEKHIAHINSLGMTLPVGFPCYEPYIFWFEAQGITL